MTLLCEICNKNKVCLVRPSDRSKLCKKCFLYLFEEEVHNTILKKRMLEDGDKICIGVSGGKDSSVLAHVLVTLKKRYKYNWDLFFLAIDEGIKGYRDDSLKVVYNLQKIYSIPLKILKFDDLFSYTMDTVVKYIGKKNNCTVCGVFRRQALEKGALLFNSTKLVTGHNADDMAETILMNLCRGDIEKLASKGNEFNGLKDISEKKSYNNKISTDESSCICKSKPLQNISTLEEKNLLNESQEKKINDLNNNNDNKYDNNNNNHNESNNDTNKQMKENMKKQKKPFFLPRMKPLMLCYEKEIVLYAFHLQLEYFSTECIYSPNSFRGNLRSFIKDIEIINPQFILNIIHSAEFFCFNEERKRELQSCSRCGAYTSQNICKACVIKSGLDNYTDNSFLYSNKKKKVKKINIKYEPSEFTKNNNAVIDKIESI